MSNLEISNYFVHLDNSLRQVIQRIDNGLKGIVFVVDQERHLIDTITDGDIRRAMLIGLGLDSSIEVFLKKKNRSVYPQPITARYGKSYKEILSLMEKHVIRQIPLVDEAGRVVDLVTIEDIMPRENLPMKAVVMAGGFGTRLSPLTDEIPKPMLPVGDRPLMERIINQLQQTGIRRVSITTHFMAEKIKNHFGDGREFGVSIDYVEEDRPLGTAGALGLMKSPDEPLLVINGDILTRVDFRAMLDFHRKYQADLTLGVRQYEVDVPYGVVERQGPLVKRLREKPRYRFFVNAGIYLLEPSVHAYIPDDCRFDMTDLIEKLIGDERVVVNFPIMEYWLDIGQPVDYKKAQEDVENGRV
ncbi:MAG: nucleotidyltransferase family protein [Anaerolineales bacterium]|nr:nucleotidyltransferase family protein [Anaerolineales bacterium]